MLSVNDFLMNLQIYQVTDRIHFGWINLWRVNRLPGKLKKILKYTGTLTAIKVLKNEKKITNKNSFNFDVSMNVCISRICVHTMRLCMRLLCNNIYLIIFVFIDTLTNWKRQSILYNRFLIFTVFILFFCFTLFSFRLHNQQIKYKFPTNISQNKLELLCSAVLSSHSMFTQFDSNYYH